MAGFDYLLLDRLLLDRLLLDRLLLDRLLVGFSFVLSANSTLCVDCGILPNQSLASSSAILYRALASLHCYRMGGLF
jgi:hypothetical protein